MTDTLLRFNDLKSRKIVTNHPTRRWIVQEGFPPGRWLGPNTRVWTETEINQWLLNRPYARADMRTA